MLLKKDAQKKCVFGKASTIALQLGISQSKAHGSIWTYSFEGLEIWYDDYGPNLSITFNGQDVFFQHLYNIDSYRPDITDWMDKLDEVHNHLAMPKLLKEAEQKTQEHNQELFSKWGIT